MKAGPASLSRSNRKVIGCYHRHSGIAADRIVKEENWNEFVLYSSVVSIRRD